MRAEFLRKLRKGVSRLVSQQVSSGFVSWRVAVCARDDPMSTALRYLFNRALARGWLAWQETWAELTRARESLGRGLGHLLHRDLSRGFCAWVEMAVDRAEFLRKLRKGLGFVVHRQAALGFNGCWLQTVARSKRRRRAPPR